jgi:hypothetical protein
VGAHAPLQGHALSHADFARRYLHAARYIPAGYGESFFPRLHLFGQAIELALKSYLWRRGQKPPRGERGHNLVELAESAQRLGLQLSDEQIANVVVRVSAVYFERDDGERYMSRYPILEGSVWVTPGEPAVTTLVESIIGRSGGGTRGRERREVASGVPLNG